MARRDMLGDKRAAWDARYAAAPAEGLFGAGPNAYLRAIAERPAFAARTALFLADGDGRNSRWMAGRGVAAAAVEFSAEATRRASALDAAAGRSVERICADLALWTPGARRWDAVFLIYLQGPPPLRAAAIERGWDAVAPGGWFALEGFSAAQAGGGMGPNDPAQLYETAAVVAMLPGARVEEALSGTLRLDEGVRHQGLAAVTRVLARKP